MRIYAKMTEEKFLIIGLGNPGSHYANTRHNVGFRVIEKLAERALAKSIISVCRSIITETKYLDKKITLAKPITFMNNSGLAVKMLIEKFQIDLSRVIVISDDLNLELGVLRCRRSGSHGGQNGLRSIIDLIGSEDFPRIRIGIGKPTIGSHADHVLSEFTTDEKPIIDQVIESAVFAVETFLTDGIDRSMQLHNRKIEITNE